MYYHKFKENVFNLSECGMLIKNAQNTRSTPLLYGLMYTKTNLQQTDVCKMMEETLKVATTRHIRRIYNNIRRRIFKRTV